MLHRAVNESDGRQINIMSVFFLILYVMQPQLNYQSTIKIQYNPTCQNLKNELKFNKNKNKISHD